MEIVGEREQWPIHQQWLKNANPDLVLMDNELRWQLLQYAGL